MKKKKTLRDRKGDNKRFIALNRIETFPLVMAARSNEKKEEKIKIQK